MKIIKLGSNAVAGKDYTLEVPVVVKPAVIRYVSRNLKDLAKSNPDLAIVYTDEQYANLPASIKNKLEDPEKGLLTSNVVEVESAINPAEEFSGDIPSADLVDELFLSSLDSLDDLAQNISSAGKDTLSLAKDIVLTSATGHVYQNYAAVSIPVKWVINNKENVAENATVSGKLSSEVSGENNTNSVSMEQLVDDEVITGYRLVFGFVSPAEEGGDPINTAFMLTAEIDMNGAIFFESADNLTNGTQITSPVLEGFKKKFTFDVLIHGESK